MAINLESLTVTDGDAGLFASAGRPKSALGEAWLPVVNKSWHTRSEDGRGKPQGFHVMFGDVEEATRGLRAAGKLAGCSVSVRWVPSDVKRHEATLAARNASVTDSSEWKKLGVRLDSTEGMLHFRAVPPITRPRNKSEVNKAEVNEAEVNE